jgi:hypothetical protein
MKRCWLPLLFVAGAASQELRIVDAVVSETAGGPRVPENRAFEAGQRVHVSFTVSGFKTVADTSNIFLEFRVEPVDRLGVLFDRPFEGRLITSTERKETRPIRFDFVVPQAPMPGEGMFRIAVTDRVADQVARGEAPFQVASALPPPVSGEFEISGFRYFSSEYSDGPMERPKFRGGDTVWGRFYLSGFSTVENNRYRLSYGVTLRDKAGRAIFSEQQAVSETRESFYPRTHVPGLISVRLESAIRPGDYLLEIAATDEIGNRRTTRSFALRVE